MWMQSPTPAGMVQAGPTAASLIKDQIGPQYADLRPGKATTSSTFPVYRNLVRDLVKAAIEHPDPTAAHVLATCAGYAYSDVGTVAMMMTRMGLERSRCREITRSVDAMFIRSTAHLVQSNDGRVVILCYRGTPPLDIISWFLNADVYPEMMATAVGASRRSRREQPYEVHAGFYRNVRVTRHEIIRALEQALSGGSVLDGATDGSFAHVSGAQPAGDDDSRIRPMEALYITGHSLGGAMAVIMATMLVMSDNDLYRGIAGKLRAVYTFGQPMVGTPAFAEAAAGQLRAANVPVIRYVYRRDPVPQLPPRDVGDYEHVGDEYRFEDEWPDSPTPPSTQIWSAAGLATAFLPFGLNKLLPFRGLPLVRNIEDHFPHHYVSALIPPGKTDEFGDYFVRRR